MVWHSTRRVARDCITTPLGVPVPSGSLVLVTRQTFKRSLHSQPSMPAYVRVRAAEFLEQDPHALLGQLQRAYAEDGFVSLYTKQTIAWASIIPLLRTELASLVLERPDAREWALLLEFPLYRLRKRIDLVILAHKMVVVVEAKVGENDFKRADERQVEEYALDLRDFHAGSTQLQLMPVLWCTASKKYASPFCRWPGAVGPVFRVGEHGLAGLLRAIPSDPEGPPLIAESWDSAPYRPVPGIIEAATAILPVTMSAALRKQTPPTCTTRHLGSCTLFATPSSAKGALCAS
jgi:hypothetical protein